MFAKFYGYCPICNKPTEFRANNQWFRDHLLCLSCNSIPRERALISVINQVAPTWRDKIIHESSPAQRGVSQILKKEAGDYLSSQYLGDNIKSGEIVNGVRHEDLELLSFPDNSIDLHITQDVMEHVFDYKSAFKEIARTLKPGGMHIFTVPIVRKYHKSVIRAEKQNGNIIHHLPEEYHGNPVGDGKALVTVDWGFDICNAIFESSGLFTQVFHINDISQGIQAEYIEVLVTTKPLI